MKKLLIATLAVILLSPVAKAMNLVYSGVAISTNGPVTFTANTATQSYTLDMNATGVPTSGDVIESQISYTSYTATTQNFTDGNQATMTVTVASNAGITGAQATNTLTVSSNSALVGLNASFTLNGTVFQQGGSWIVGASSAATAVNIMTYLNTVPNIGVIASTSSIGVVTLTASSSGTYANSFTLVSSSQAALGAGAATFSGGKNFGVFGLNNHFISFNQAALVGASAAASATNLAAAINADSYMSTVIVASAAAGSAVVTATTTANAAGSSFATYSSTQSALTLAPFTSSSPVTGIATGTMFGGSNSSYTLTSPTLITITNHGLTTGFGVLYTTSTAVTIAPLVWGTTYYVIRVDANNFSLASSLANAQAGTALVFTSSSTSTTTHAFVLTPLNLAGTLIFTLQKSIDGINWVAIGTGENGATISATSVASPWTAGTTMADIGIFHARYLRLQYAGPTTGGLGFTWYLNIKNNKSY